MKKRLVFIALATAVAAGGAGIGFALTNWTATQHGVHQHGSGAPNTLTIAVEAGIGDANGILVPDLYNQSICSPTAFTPPGCDGGALEFSIQNTSAVPLKVTDIRETAFPSPPCTGACIAPINSDRNDDGTWNTPSTTAINCGGYAWYSEPPNFGNLTLKQWPIIPAHSTLQVNGTDNYALGKGMIHLTNLSPNNCQGASYSVPLTVTAVQDPTVG